MKCQQCNGTGQIEELTPKQEGWCFLICFVGAFLFVWWIAPYGFCF